MHFFPSARGCLAVVLALLLPGLLLAADGSSRWQTRAERYLGFDRTNPPPTGGIVFAGSSSIDMWRTLHADFPDLPVVNRGIGGTWLADLAEFAPRLVYPLRPRIIVIYAGENDLSAGRTVDDVVNAFQSVRAQIRHELPSAKIVFISLKPSPSRRALLPAMRDANTRIKQLCAEEPACTFIDVFNPMLTAQSEPREELFIADELHMNAEGYKLWTQLMTPVLHGLN